MPDPIMSVEYIESEKVWRSPCLKLEYSSLGEAIFSKLNESDPKRVVEIEHESGKESTVDDIRRQTIIVAQNLKRLGVKKGDTVILYSQSNPRVTPITFACYAIGAPVNFFQIGFEKCLISYNFELLDPTVIIFEEEFREQIFTCVDSLPLAKLKHTLSIDSYELFKPCVNVLSFLPTLIEDATRHPGTFIFTSGSSGIPKIVVLSHAMMMRILHCKWWPIDKDSITCCIADLRWAVQVVMMLEPVFFGSKRVYTSRPDSSICVEEKKAIIDEHKITHFFELPMYYLELLVLAGELKDPKGLSSLKFALLTGEVVAETIVDYSKRVIPNCKLIKRYGMTEVAGHVCTNEFFRKYNTNGNNLKDGFIVKIIDDDGSSLGPNEAGRLCLKCTVPILGYLKNEEANKKAFLEGGWYDTGDYALMDSDNLLHILGRYNHLLRSSGTILVPSVVEGIVNNHPSVFLSALVGHASLENSRDHVGTLFVVPVSDHQLLSNKIDEELREFLSKKLTADELNIIRCIKLIPKIPVKTCGKTDRSTLKVLADENQKLV